MRRHVCGAVHEEFRAQVTEFLDGRVSRIYVGSTAIMKVIVGQSLCG